MGLFHLGAPGWLVDWCAETTGIVLAIETGTYHGDSAAIFASKFGRCVTIEREPLLAARARARFASDPRVDVIEGSSREELPRVCDHLTEAAFFWLDGHWSGGGTAGRDDPCPVLAEIESIERTQAANQHVVAIDDPRLFGYLQYRDPSILRWPSLVRVLEAVERLGLATFCADDVIVGVPEPYVESFLKIGHETAMRQDIALATMWPSIRLAAKAQAVGTRVRARLRRADR